METCEPDPSGKNAAAPVCVAVAIVRRNGDVLVTRRPAGAHLERLWEFPGGKMQPGESPEECARREVCEETGLLVEVVEELAVVTHHYPERTVTIHFLTSRLTGGDLNPCLQEGRWVSISDLRYLPMPAANAGIVRRLMS